MSSKSAYIVALDQGTTSSRTIIYDDRGAERFKESVPLQCAYPEDAWVEQDPMEIWSTQLESLRAASKHISASEIKAIGITNQRETTVVWDRNTGEPLAPAIVWQCRRSANICSRLKQLGHEERIREKTGLVLDAYFSGSKILWFLENITGLKEKVADGTAVFGTVDSWILYNLSGGAKCGVLATEPSNASRTMLYNIAIGDWDEELLGIFGISRANLPELHPSWGEFGKTSVLGPEIPVTGILGDQQASLLGHGCSESNSVKCTLGTGAFMLMNTGEELRRSSTGLLSTVAWGSPKLPDGTQASCRFAMEGSVFIAGALIQWLRDSLGLIKSSGESEAVASSVSSSEGVVVVPAFVGLGAPHWDEAARGCIIGLTRDTSGAHIVRASLEAIAHQVADLMEDEEFRAVSELRVDGGMIENSLFCQILADLCRVRISKAATGEATAFGAARIAAWGAGLFGSEAELLEGFVVSGSQNSQNSVESFKPTDEPRRIDAERCLWKRAVSRSSNWLGI